MGIFCSQDNFRKELHFVIQKQNVGPSRVPLYPRMAIQNGDCTLLMNFLKTSICKWHFKHIHCPAFTKEQIPFLPLSPRKFWHDSEFFMSQKGHLCPTLNSCTYIKTSLLRKTGDRRKKTKQGNKTKEKVEINWVPNGFPYAINSLHLTKATVWEMIPQSHLSPNSQKDPIQNHQLKPCTAHQLSVLPHLYPGHSGRQHSSRRTKPWDAGLP